MKTAKKEEGGAGLAQTTARTTANMLKHISTVWAAMADLSVNGFELDTVPYGLELEEITSWIKRDFNRICSYLDLGPVQVCYPNV